MPAVPPVLDFAHEVIDAMGQGLLVTNAEPRIEYVNSRLCEMLGLSSAALLGRKVLDLVAEEDKAAILARRSDRRSGRRSEYEAHLIRADGEPVRVLLAHVPRLRDGAYVGGIVVVTDLTRRKQMEDELHHRAQHDPLTDLPNRMLLLARLEEAVGSRSTGAAKLAVMVLDLDGFKDVNDRFGLRVGDALLMQVAERWRALLRDGDTLARLGGDEFAIILRTNGARSRCTAVAQRLVRAVARPFKLDQTTVHTGVSIGVAIASSNVADPEELLRRADVAMYRAKRGGGRWAMYTPDLDEAASLERVSCSTDLAGPRALPLEISTADDAPSSNQPPIDPDSGGLTTDQLAVLQLVSTELAAELEPVRLARLVVEELRTRFGYELPSVYFVQSDRKLHLAAQLGYADPMEVLDMQTGITGRVARNMQPLLIRDVSADPDFKAATYGLVSEVCVPIVSGGRLLGIINVETRRRGVLADRDVILVELLAQMLAVALCNADLYIAAKRRADEIATVQLLATDVASLREPDELARTVVRELRERFAYQLVGLYVRMDHSHHLIASAGYSDDVRTTFDPTTGVVGRVLRTGCPALVDDPVSDPDFVATVDGVSAQVCVPICAGDRILGALSVETTGPDRFGASDLNILGLLAAHLAVAIENARLFRAVQQENTERARAVAALRQSEQRYRHLVEEAQDILYRTDANGRFTYVNPTASRITGLSREELLGRHYLEVVHPDDRFRLARFYAGQAKGQRTDTYCEFRCVRGDGSLYWIGQNVRLLSEGGKILGFHAVARDITSLKEIESALRTAHDFADQVIQNAGEGIVVYDKNLNYVVWNPVMERLTGLSASEVLGRSPRELFPEHLHRNNMGPILERALAGETVRTGDMEFTVPQTGLAGWMTGIYTPHFDGGRSVDGVIGIISDVTAHKRAQEALAYQASHDALTGFPNRPRLHDRLQEHVVEAQQSGSSLALLVVDLDGFKEVNDTLGHPVGDALLREISARWRELIPDLENAARLGGDEFAIVLPGADAPAAHQFAQALERSLDAPFVLESRVLSVRASVGIALMPTDATDADTLLKYADVAMYQAKRASAGWAFYSPDKDNHRGDRLLIASELREAVERNKLTLHYQPKLDCASGAPVGVEALARWHHPRLGNVPPSDFIPLAEQLGIVRRLSRWVLGTAVRQCHDWLAEGNDIRIAVNLSAQDLHDLELPEVVASLLEQWHVPAANLEIEITETQMMIDPQRSAATLDRLGALGVAIAVDDYGTGYSSLAYLKRLPVSAVKIDRSFVSNMLSDEHDRVIVRSTIGMAHELGLSVVAEGVEDYATLELLRSWGCDQAQGYYLGRAVPASDITPMDCRQTIALATRRGVGKLADAA